MIDLFSGAGLFGYAFEQEGFKLVRAVEKEAAAGRTHHANLGARLDVADVASVVPEGRCDILIAGPPCQGFSTLGKRRTNDPRNWLCMHVVTWARSLGPSVVVVENVVPFVDSAPAKELRSGLRSLGYTVEVLVLNALNYGVAQHRVRAFTIASMSGGLAAPLPADEVRTVRDAIQDLPGSPSGENDHVAPIPTPLALSRMRLVPPGGGKHDILREAPHLAPPSWHRSRTEITDVWGRLRWDEPANTLRTCLLNPSKGRYIHPCQDRVISLREAARLHSIPDSWTFRGTPYQVARQIGNSVPPLLGRAVARQAKALVN